MRSQFKVQVFESWEHLPGNLQQVWVQLGCDYKLDASGAAQTASLASSGLSKLARRSGIADGASLASSGFTKVARRIGNSSRYWCDLYG